MPTSRSGSAFVLDTHAWIWFVRGDPSISAPGVALLQQAAQQGQIGLAAISLWEVAMLDSKGRLRLDQDCVAWLNEALAKSGASVFPLTPEIAVKSTCLPGLLLGDPADRMIAATAIVRESTLVTRDRDLLAYAQAGYLRAVPI